MRDHNDCRLKVSRDMANHSSIRQETGGGASQMAEEDIACHMEG